MFRERLALYRDRARSKLLAAFRREHTPHQIATSFSIGIFVTNLPSGGLGIGLFFVLVAIWSWISKPAIFASVAVLNPFVKPAIYVASFQVGGLFVQTPSIDSVEPTAEMATAAVYRLLVGNVVVGVSLSLAAYAVVYHLARVYRRRKRRGADSSAFPTVAQLFRR